MSSVGSTSPHSKAPIHSYIDDDQCRQVLARQAVQECYVALAPGSLPLFRQLQFMGGCAFNVLMAAGSLVSVIVYEHLGYAAPFYVRARSCVPC
jgi:hypothetical protein